MAAEGGVQVRNTPLDLTTISEGDHQGATKEGDVYTNATEGWKWDASGATGVLTLSGATINCSSVTTTYYAIMLPAGATINLVEGTVNTVTAGSKDGYSFGIMADGKYYIAGNGTLNVTSSDINGTNQAMVSSAIYGNVYIGTKGVDYPKVNARSGNVNDTKGTDSGTDLSIGIGGATISSGAIYVTCGTVTKGSIQVSGSSIAFQSVSAPDDATITGLAQPNVDKANLQANDSAEIKIIENYNTSRVYESITQKEAKTVYIVCKSPTPGGGGTTDTDPTFNDSFGDTATKANYSTYTSSYTNEQGYALEGWYDAAGTKLTGTPANGTTYYAKWTKNGKTVITKPLDFTSIVDATNKSATEGWQWNANTLTLSGATIDCSAVTSSYAIKLPNNAKIILADNTENKIKAGYKEVNDYGVHKVYRSYGIDVGDGGPDTKVSITGNGILEVRSSDITNATIETRSYAINAGTTKIGTGTDYPKVNVYSGTAETTSDGNTRAMDCAYVSSGAIYATSGSNPDGASVVNGIYCPRDAKIISGSAIAEATGDKLGTVYISPVDGIVTPTDGYTLKTIYIVCPEPPATPTDPGTGGGSTGGGSTGGSSGGGSATQAPTITDGDNGPGAAPSTIADLVPTTTKDGDITTTKAKVDENLGKQIVDKAVANKSDEIIIDLTTPNDVTGTDKIPAVGAQTGKNSEIIVPGSAVKEIVDKTIANLVIKTDNGQLVVDQKTLNTISEQAGGKGDVTFFVEVIKDDPASHQMKLMIKTANGTVSEFKGGNVEVIVKLNADMQNEDLACVCESDDGILSLIQGTKDALGRYKFKTLHFSTYTIMPREEAEKLVNGELTTLLKEMKLTARSVRMANKNVKITLNVDYSQIEKMGYTVKCKYYRSTKKASAYKTKMLSATKKYVNTGGKTGTKYYYKGKVCVYDKDGNLVGQTALNQCKYACRVWTK